MGPVKRTILNGSRAPQRWGMSELYQAGVIT